MESSQQLPVLKLPGIDASKFTEFTYSFNTARGTLNLRVRRAGGGGNIGKAGGFCFTNKGLVGLDIDSMANALPVLIERAQRENKPLKPHVNLVQLCTRTGTADAVADTALCTQPLAPHKLRPHPAAAAHLNIDAEGRHWLDRLLGDGIGPVTKLTDDILWTTEVLAQSALLAAAADDSLAATMAACELEIRNGQANPDDSSFPDPESFDPTFRAAAAAAEAVAKPKKRPPPQQQQQVLLATSTTRKPKRRLFNEPPSQQQLKPLQLPQ
jgi:hypothetical protein